MSVITYRPTESLTIPLEEPNKFNNLEATRVFILKSFHGKSFRIRTQKKKEVFY